MKENVLKTNNFYIPLVNFHPRALHLQTPREWYPRAKKWQNIYVCETERIAKEECGIGKAVGTISHTFAVSFTRI